VWGEWVREWVGSGWWGRSGRAPPIIRECPPGDIPIVDHTDRLLKESVRNKPATPPKLYNQPKGATAKPHKVPPAKTSVRNNVVDVQLLLKFNLSHLLSH
jgi:hypothetical protein